MTSPLLTGRFQVDRFMNPFPVKAETVIKLSIKFLFGDVGLSIRDSILGALSLFLTIHRISRHPTKDSIVPSADGKKQ